jgi:hypothetical protein
VGTYFELDAGQAVRARDVQVATELAHLNNSLIHSNGGESTVRDTPPMFEQYNLIATLVKVTQTAHFSGSP